MNILIIAAHPDDEVLGCGGTMARLSDEGHDVFVSILGEGITSRYTNRTEADQNAIDSLHACSHRVGELLGIKKVYMDRLPDNQFDTVPLLEIIKKIEKLIDTVQAEIVFTQHGGDLNIDHVVLHRAVMTATRPMKGRPVKKVCAYEVPSSSEWAFQQFAPAFRPSVFYDIEETLERKIQAMKLYESESNPFPHPRSSEALYAYAKRWGSVVGCQAAEAFELIWSLQ